MKLNLRAAMIIALMGSTGFLVACGKSNEQAVQQQQMPNPVVDVQTITLQTVPVIQSFAGRVAASETSEVRPQATGVVEEVLFREGSIVQAGQPLYRINVDNYTSSVQAGEAAVRSAEAAVGNAQATRASAQANLAAQQANLAQARADLARYEGLLEVQAVSRQLYDQAVTAVRTAQANVEAAKAAVAQADANIASASSSVQSAKASLGASQLDIGRTIVKAPISGVTGISAVTAGALVATNQATPLVTISRLNEVYVDISQSAAEMLRLREQIESGQAGQGSAEVQLVLEDGQTYPMLGRLLLANARVDESTGAMTLRAIFPNPQGKLVPGMFVNARLIQSVVQNAALLPQSAIMRTPTGETQVYIVNADNKVELRNITTSGTYNGNWIVTGGINSGDRVVIIGGSKVKPDQEVTARELPAASSEANAAAQAPAGNQPAANAATVPMARPSKDGDTADAATEAEAAADSSQ
ncbi:membrane fusion protein, multidrug efflux system [Moraxella cuniculi DSM 21768]|uniref:Membrane fusion protein, multidrug efflux system n=1 Tax=Moraxella cuniculi DSM 21768 TaxID=1122245 RepID=A0A1N7FXX7_9GAMM|nr:efflux RND transporter periplasmic adaptor subunit [Moraxella cuniculi]OOS04396.1 efflux transporter periplasmic adaptor subunit [Moraxella cuniculi]SIS05190.1 membrane fusion protein, multidrug efflux system [Moraxella cuniculi DSM 21768]